MKTKENLLIAVLASVDRMNQHFLCGRLASALSEQKLQEQIRQDFENITGRGEIG